MVDSTSTLATDPNTYVRGYNNRIRALSWEAVIAGGVVAAALSLVLLALGSGLGFSSISPWAGAGASPKAIGVATIIWLMLMQLISASIGGYIAGRLRNRWQDVHSDEVFFRDTAHGFLVWALGVLMTAAFLTSAAASLASGGLKLESMQMKSSGLNPQIGGQSTAYFVDLLLRRDQAPVSGANGTSPNGASSTALANEVIEVNDIPARTELARALIFGFQNGALTSADHAYLVQQVSLYSGLDPTTAEKRVDDVVAQFEMASEQTRAAVDAARKAAAHSSLWIFISLLIGAFCASYFATIGGRLRDRSPF